MSLVFLNVRDLLQLHSTLLEELEHFTCKGEKDGPIGPLFLVFEPCLQIYKQYVGNFHLSTKRVNWLMKIDKKFSNLMNEKTDQLNFLRLSPLNRITHYQTYLEALKNVTPSDERDFIYLQQVLSKLEKLKVGIGDTKPLYLLIQLQNTILNCPVCYFLLHFLFSLFNSSFFWIKRR